MPFALRCPSCNALIKAPDKAAGRTAPCPGCKTPVTFPKTPPAPGASEPPAVTPNLSLDEPLAKPAAMPNLSLDDPPKKREPPATKPAAKPAPSPAGATDSVLSDLNLDDMPGLVGDDSAPPKKPAAAPKAAPPRKEPPAPAKKPEPKPRPTEAGLADLNLDDMPGLVGDAAPKPAPKPTAAPKPAAAPKPPSAKKPEPKPAEPALPNLSLDDMPGLVGDDPAPKPAPPKAAPPKKEAPAPAKKPKSKPAEAALPDLSLDDMPGLVGDGPAPKPAPPPPAKAAPASSKPAPQKSAPAKPEPAPLDMTLDDPPRKAPAGVPKMELDEEDLPLLEDAGEDADLEDLDEVMAVEEDTDHLDEVEALDEVMAVEEDVADRPRKKRRRPEEIDELEEVDEDEDEDGRSRRRSSSPLADSRLLQLRKIFVKAQKMSLGQAVTGQNEAGHDLIDPEAKRKMGRSREIRDATTQVLRHLVHSSFVEAKVEITERGELLATIKRAAHMPTLFQRAMLEIRDADDRLLGMFEDRPFSRLMQKPMSIVNKHNEMLLQMRSDWTHRRMEFLDVDGEVLGELKAGDGSGRFKIELVRGRSCQITFRTKLDDRPEDKLRFLAAVIGLDLFDRDR